ncbi:MAG: hypothetical protein SPL52_02720 [Fibrobacter sp.]|nr:hypothetical protein [Fibrobacter sp.]
MKKVLAVLPAVALALTACVSSTDDSNATASPTQPQLPTDYIISEMGEYSYAADGTLEITKATCTDYANEAVWKKTTQVGSLTDAGNGTAQMDLGDGAGKNTYEFRVAAGEQFPEGNFYKSSTLNDPLIWGVVLEDPYYSDVIYINTDCIFENFGEMQETLSLIAKVPKSSINMSCKTLSIEGLEMTYVSHTQGSIEYTVSYGGVTSNVKQAFRYAFVENDCRKAFKDYQQEYENGETQEFFNFDLYDQDISASAEFVDLITNFHNRTGLAKSAPTLTEKQIKDIFRAIGSKLRHGK